MDLRGARAASSVQVMFCSGCYSPHVVLLDENDRPFAHFTLDAKNGPPLIEGMRKGLYRSAVEKD